MMATSKNNFERHMFSIGNPDAVNPGESVAWSDLLE